MPSCEIIGSSFGARITYKVTQDIQLNRSVVRVTRVEMRSLSSMNLSCYIKGTISINGNQAATLALTDTTGCAVDMTKNYSGGGEGDSWFSGFSTKNITVNHQEDGTAQIAVYANLFVYYNQAPLDYGINKTVYPYLPAIPRVSQLEAEDGTLGQPLTIRITREASGFTDTLSWHCGSLEGTIAEKTEQTELEWTPPIELAEQQTQDTKVSIVLTVTTYRGDTQVGTREKEVICHIPEDVVPILLVWVSDKTGIWQEYNAYVQSISKIIVQSTAEGIYGSTIQDIQVRCGKMTGSGDQVVFAMDDCGSIPITVTATDSRGRIARHEKTIQVQPYQKPSVTIREAFRCDEQGEPQPDGEYLKVVFDAEANKDYNKLIFYYGVCTVHNGEEQRKVTLLEYLSQSSVQGGSFIMSAGQDTAYECQVIVQDDYNKVTSQTALVNVAFVLMDLCRSTKAVGIGMRAKNPQKLSIGVDTDMNECAIGNMADPTKEQDAATKAYVDRVIGRVYPVGSIYISVTDTPPDSLFGGTWERIADTFLLASGESYPPGSTGGVGADAAHNNMPPYLAVYMWKRVE